MFKESTLTVARFAKIPVTIDDAIPDERDRLMVILREGVDTETAGDLAIDEVQLTFDDGQWYLGPLEEN